MEALNHKARTRQRILAEAAVAMREQGTEGIGVAALMKRAGLTHGGFYAHFASRDDLVANVIAYIFEQTLEKLRSSLQSDTAEGLSQFIDAYLSMAVRNAPGESCPLPALSGEAARLSRTARDNFANGVTQMQALLAKCLTTLRLPQPDVLAVSMLSEMIGAMALARACPHEQHAEHILLVSRQSIKHRVGLGENITAG
ncbi:TetR family transcriptional regulator [Paramixta manurensis]|uniref:TetR family transcriptional regulator n=1 Tax=Paramixta manurensis TaxID=2740817 RepID=A0A6M8UUG2_9GAMM|nr:TetR family transcriptional regulator [Erwiniaceae bacterium PD-1]